MPDARRYPRQAAESVRSFLMVRLALHLGLRQKNLRELLYSPRGCPPTAERILESRRCGELRWSERDQGWEVLIPACAFKNSTSSFFGNKPFRLVLPDLGELYRYIESYINGQRALLLNGAPDPGTFLVKTMKATSRDAAYNQNTFYEAWRLITQRYGIRTRTLVAERLQGFCHTDHTTCETCWRRTSSSKPVPMNRQAMQFRIRRRPWQSTTAVFSRKIRLRSRR